MVYLSAVAIYQEEAADKANEESAVTSFIYPQFFLDESLRKFN